MTWKSKLLTNTPLKVGDIVYFKATGIEPFIIKEIGGDDIIILEDMRGQLHSGFWSHTTFTKVSTVNCHD